MEYSNCAVEDIEKKKVYDLTWMDKKIPYLKSSNGLYKFCCFFLGKKDTKLSYKELYLILYGINKHKLGEDKAKDKALGRILKLYKDINKKLPLGIEEDDVT